MSINLVDRSTGEIINSGKIAYIPSKQRNGFTEGWTAVSNEAIKYMFELRQENVIQARHTDVLTYLATACLDFENLVAVSQTEVAKGIGMPRSHVSRCMAKLVELGFLYEGDKIGRTKTYRLNPNVGWKGSAKNHRAALAKARGLRVVKGGK